MPGMLEASLADNHHNTDLVEMPMARSSSLKRLRSINWDSSSSEQTAVVYDLRKRRLRKQAVAKSPVSVASCCESSNEEFSTNHVVLGQEYFTMSNDEEMDILARQISYSRQDVPIFENIDDIDLSDWCIQQEDPQSAVHGVSQQLNSAVNDQDDNHLVKEALLLLEGEEQEVPVVSNPQQVRGNNDRCDSPHDNIHNDIKHAKQKEMKEKERVRGSYRCSRCGLPKANHICQVTIGTSVSIQTSNTAAIVDVSSSGTLNPFSGERFVSFSGGCKRKTSESHSGSSRSRGGSSSSGMLSLGDVDNDDESSVSLVGNRVKAHFKDPETQHN